MSFDPKKICARSARGQIRLRRRGFVVPIRILSATKNLRPRGFEPLAFCSVDRRSIQLSYGRMK